MNRGDCAGSRVRARRASRRSTSDWKRAPLVVAVGSYPWLSRMACRISWRATARGAAAAAGGEPATHRTSAQAVTPSLDTRQRLGIEFGLAVLRNVHFPPVPSALLAPARLQLAVGQPAPG